MKVNIQKERNFFKKFTDKNKKAKEVKSLSKSVKREQTKSRLTSLNSDIEKLYKKYTEIRKERLLKEKSQQILVNRLKYLRNESKRSLSKKEHSPSKRENLGEENKKIYVKINSKYKTNVIIKNYKEWDKQNGGELFNDNESLSKTSFNGNESEIIGSSYKSSNSIKISSNKNVKSFFMSRNIFSGIFFRNLFLSRILRIIRIPDRDEKILLILPILDFS